MDPLRIGIVGMGIGRTNGRALHRHPRAQVAALCDLVPERMEPFAQELGTPLRRYTDHMALCQDPEIDAIFVGTPNQWHVPVALEAVRQGKHVMVTKPLADCEAAARSLVEAAEAAGVVNMMSLPTRFAPEVAYLGQLRDQGRFGEIYYARASSVRRSGIPDWSAGFVRAGGGAFRDMGVHFLDAAWWLMGMPEPESVLGAAGARFGPQGVGYWRFRTPPADIPPQFASDDYAGGVIRFTNGAALYVESFWASHHPESRQIDLFGERAGAQLIPLCIYQTETGAPQDVAIQLPEGPDGWDRIADHFVSCCLDGVPCQAPLRHGLQVQVMMEALLRSAETGCEVRF